jgi:hypothetical protein
MSTRHHQALFWHHCRGRSRRPLQGEFFARTSFTLFYCFALLYFYLHRFIKNPKKLESLIVAFIYLLLFIMSSLDATTMSPEKMIFAFKQKNEESFKEAWSRIYYWHGKTEPRMTLSLLLSCFYFGLALRYRYALDAIAKGDFLHCDGDQAFYIIKKLITIYSMPTSFDNDLVSILID